MDIVEEIPQTGPGAILHALQQLDLDQLEKQQREIVRSNKKSKRPGAVKVLNIIEGLRRNELQPSELMISRVPVIPPAFRPFSVMGSTFVAGDANELYATLIKLKQAQEEEAGEFGDENTGDSKLAIYDAVKATYGYGDPVDPKSRQRGVSGFLKKITGTNPKLSFFQNKLIGKPQDSVARGVITVDPDLSLDEIGIPEEMAWKMYAPYIQKRLVRMGMAPSKALQDVQNRASHALKALQMEVGERPVIYSRAPSWHKYNVISGKPKLISGATIKINPLVTSGLNADFDGDTINLHVPSQSDAVKEAWDVLMPSRMLFATRDRESVVPKLKHEQVLGGFAAGQRPSMKKHIFSTEEEALSAINSGQISLSDDIEIPGNNLDRSQPLI
jgi:DNA-directed RNA polymerase subunit beta'